MSEPGVCAPAAHHEEILTRMLDEVAAWSGALKPLRACLTPGRPVWRLAWVIVFGAFTSGLDASLANIGLDTIRTDLHTTLDRVQWVSSGYLVALAVSLPICGWLGRRVGTGRLWLAALAAFTLASGLCAAAPGIGALVALRVVQGLAAGLLIPAGQTILGRAVGPGRLGRVMATLGIVVTVAPAIGPIVGAAVLHSLSWRWLFLINLPIGALGIALGLRYVPRGRGEAVAPLWTGSGSRAPRRGAAAARLRVHRVGFGRRRSHRPLVVGVAALAAFGVRSLRPRASAHGPAGSYRDRVYADGQRRGRLHRRGDVRRRAACSRVLPDPARRRRRHHRPVAAAPPRRRDRGGPAARPAGSPTASAGEAVAVCGNLPAGRRHGAVRVPGRARRLRRSCRRCSSSWACPSRSRPSPRASPRTRRSARNNCPTPRPR